MFLISLLNFWQSSNLVLWFGRVLVVENNIHIKIRLTKSYVHFFIGELCT